MNKMYERKNTDFQQNTAWKDHNHIPLYERICVQPLKTFVRTPLLCIQHVAKIIVICSDHNPPWFVDEIPTLMFFTLFLSMGSRKLWLSKPAWLRPWRALCQTFPVGPSHHHNAAPWNQPIFMLNLFMSSWILHLGTKHIPASISPIAFWAFANNSASAIAWQSGKQRHDTRQLEQNANLA